MSVNTPDDQADEQATLLRATNARIEQERRLEQVLRRFPLPRFAPPAPSLAHSLLR